MPSRFLEINTFIDELYIKNCELKAITRYAFNTQCLRYLKKFGLIGNGIRKLNGKSVIGLESVHEMLLVNMPLAEFNAQKFVSFKECRALTIRSITNKDFMIRGPPYQQLAVQELYINRNDLIDSIHEKDFEGFQRVKIVDLSRNSIESIEANAFNGTNLPDLLKLDLSHNKLTKLDLNFFNGLPEKAQIIFTFNPWHCDCDLKHQLQYMASQKGIISIASCDHPNEYKGMKLMDLDWEDLCGGYRNLQCSGRSKPSERVHVRQQRLRIVNANSAMEELKLLWHGDQGNATFVLMENTNELDQKQCHTFTGNAINGTYLKFDQTYRICRFKNGMKTISILDCISFHRESWKEKESTDWIYMPERNVIMIYSLICNVGAFLIGIILAYLLAILFPVVTRNRNEHLYAENSQRIQEIKDRL